jgi:hypothetical protein
LIWLFVSKRIPRKPKEVPPIEEIPLPATPTEEEIKKPEISIPPSLISFDEEKIIEIREKEEIKEKILEEMEGKIEEGKMVRIVIKNLSEGRLANLEEILDSFQIWRPERILEKVEDFDLAIYSQKEGNRIVLIAKIKEGEKLEEIEEWREKIEREGVFLSGEKIQTFSKKFEDVKVRGKPAKYLTISKKDLGICYSKIDDYFIFSESLEGMWKVVEIFEKIKK